MFCFCNGRESEEKFAVLLASDETAVLRSSGRLPRLLFPRRANERRMPQLAPPPAGPKEY